jgi:hypothetical protein
VHDLGTGLGLDPAHDLALAAQVLDLLVDDDSAADDVDVTAT